MKALLITLALTLGGCAEINPLSSNFSVHAGSEAAAQLQVDTAHEAAVQAHLKAERSRKTLLCVKNELPKDCLDD